jgi:hypothetical protein
LIRQLTLRKPVISKVRPFRTNNLPRCALLFLSLLVTPLGARARLKSHTWLAALS